MKLVQPAQARALAKALGPPAKTAALGRPPAGPLRETLAPPPPPEPAAEQERLKELLTRRADRSAPGLVSGD